MSAASRKWQESQAANRRYQEGYEAGFERGTRAGVATDRFYCFVFGAVVGAIAAPLIRAFT